MDDLAYFEKRLRDEREAAGAATCARARECHQELAAAYDRRCRILRKAMRSEREQRIQEALESQGF